MISYHRKLKELVTFNNKYNIILEFLDESWRVIDSTIEIKIPQEWAGSCVNSAPALEVRGTN